MYTENHSSSQNCNEFLWFLTTCFFRHIHFIMVISYHQLWPDIYEQFIRTCKFPRFYCAPISLNLGRHNHFSRNKYHKFKCHIIKKERSPLSHWRHMRGWSTPLVHLQISPISYFLSIWSFFLSFYWILSI